MKHKVKTLVLIADGTPDRTGDVISKDFVHWEGDTVPVTKDFLYGRLGHAKLEWEGNELYASVTLFSEALEEYKVHPAMIQLMTPAIGGRVLERKGKNVLKCQIDQVALTTSFNADPRIKPIGEQKK